MTIKLADLARGITSAAETASSAAGTAYFAARDSAGRVGNAAKELGKTASVAVGDAVEASSELAAGASSTIAEVATKSLATVKRGADVAVESASSGAKATGAMLGKAVDAGGNVAGALGVLVGDLNGDGKVDFEDAKIAAAKMKEVAGATADELGQLGKRGLRSDLVQDAAAGAVVGGALMSLVPIPFVSTMTGVTLGAAIGACKSIGKK